MRSTKASRRSASSPIQVSAFSLPTQRQRYSKGSHTDPNTGKSSAYPSTLSSQGGSPRSRSSPTPLIWSSPPSKKRAGAAGSSNPKSAISSARLTLKDS